jgi:hypothetical protein
MKRLIQRMAGYLGYRVVRHRTAEALERRAASAGSTDSLLFQVDPGFQTEYARGLAMTGTPEAGLFTGNKRQSRFYNLLALHRWASAVQGWQVECGCWKGLSAYLLNHQLRRLTPGHDGTGFMIVDSFEGLSAPGPEDGSRKALNPSLFTGEASHPAGTYACPQDAVRKALAEFPGIEMYPGWIPGVLSRLPERRYAFVHVDLDLHDPIRGAIDYFYPRLEPGGVMVFDDYGSLFWPGAKKAVEEGAAAAGTVPVALSSGQAFIVRR